MPRSNKFAVLFWLLWLASAAAQTISPAPGSGGGSSSITIGTTTITGGTAGRLIYETSGNVVGEITGATSNGTSVTLTSPTLVTPALGVATATSIAIGGATIGPNAVAVTGSATISGVLGVHTTSPNIGAWGSGQGVVTISGTGTNWGTLEFQSLGAGTSNRIATIIGYNNTTELARIEIITDATGSTNGDIAFRNNGSETARILYNGNFGIGTTGPTRVLDVIGTAAVSTSLAIGGATIGTNALAVTGTANISGIATVGNVTTTGVAGNIFTGGLKVAAATGTGDVSLSWGGAGFIAANNVGRIGFTSSSDGSASPDAYFSRDAANTLAQRNGTTAQTFNIYNTYTDASNYERGVFDWSAVANNLTIGTTKAGTGSTRQLRIVVGGTRQTVSDGTFWQFDVDTYHHNILMLSDNTYDFGTTGATRPRTGYFGTSVIVQGTGDAASSTGGALQVAGGASVAKRFWIPAISASAGLQTAVLCQSSGGEMIADSVACLASSARFKNLAGPMEGGALAKLVALPMRRWSYKPEGIFHNEVEHVGPIAEDVAAMDPRLAGYDNEGNVRTYSTEQLLAFTIKAVQELKADNDNLREEMKKRAAR